MAGNKWAQILFVAMLVVGFGAERSLSAAENKEVKAADAIHIDIPVVLKEANVVFNMDHLAFAGDLPVGINYTLNDKTYNAYRHVSTGNPYKDRIAELLKQGVQIEECEVSMRGPNGSMKTCCRA